MEIGAQFYTVRQSCQNLTDFAETLKKVADIGYRNVQISGTCPYPAEWLKENLEKNGLKCVLTHIPVARLTDELNREPTVAEIARELGMGTEAVKSRLFRGRNAIRQYLCTGDMDAETGR